MIDEFVLLAEAAKVLRLGAVSRNNVDYFMCTVLEL